MMDSTSYTKQYVLHNDCTNSLLEDHSTNWQACNKHQHASVMMF